MKKKNVYKQVLLVQLPQEKETDALKSACESLGWQITEAQNIKEVLDLFQTNYYSIVIIDTRQNVEANELCR